MSAGAPWSVKGIDAKARSVAKELARRSGMTLGEWLNQMILEGRDVSAELAAEIEAEADLGRVAPPPAEEAGSHQIEDDDFMPAPAARAGGMSWAPAASDDRLSAARHAFDEARREALSQQGQSSARPQGDIEQVAQALESLGSRLETSETRSAHAVRGVSQAVEALLGRLERSEERVAEQEKVISDQVGEVLTSVERLSRTEEDTAMAISERLTQTERRIDQQGERLEGLSANLRDGRQRLDALEAEVRQSESDEAVKAVEGAVGSLANQIHQDKVLASTAMADVRQDMVSLSHRLAQIELRDPQKEAQGLIDQVVSRMTQRLESAEARTSASIRALEQAFSSLDARLVRAEGDSAAVPEAAKTLTQLAGDLSRRMDEARADMLSAVETAALAQAEKTAEGLEGRLNAIAAQVGAVEKRSAHALEQMGQDVLRIADNLNRRVRGVEESTEANVSRLSSEVAQLAQGTETRLEAATTTHAQALERLGGEIARISERLNAKISDAERRAAEAVDGLRDKMTVGQSATSTDISERIRASEERTQALLEEARRKIDARLGQATLQSLQARAATEAAKTPADGPDVRGSADLPNPFSSFIEALKPAATPPVAEPSRTPIETTAAEAPQGGIVGARSVAEGVRRERLTQSVERFEAPGSTRAYTTTVRSEAQQHAVESRAFAETDTLDRPVSASQATTPASWEARLAETGRPDVNRNPERLDITGHLLSGLARQDEPQPVPEVAAQTVVTDAFGERPADPFASMHDLDDDIAFEADRDAALRVDPYGKNADPFADDLLSDDEDTAAADDFVDATDDESLIDDDDFEADLEEDPFADIDMSRKTAPRAPSMATSRPDVAPQAPESPFDEGFDDIFDRDLDVPEAVQVSGEHADVDEQFATEPAARLSTRDALMSARAAVQASIEGAEDQRGMKFGIGKPRPPEAHVPGGPGQAKPQGGFLSRLIKASTVSVAAITVMVSGYYYIAPMFGPGDGSRLNSPPSGTVAGGNEEGMPRAASLIELPAGNGTSGSMSQEDRIFDLYDRAQVALKARDPGALAKLESVASLGHAGAQFELGLIYDGKLDGYAADKTLARKWYARAADKGSVEAMYNLAMMLYNAEGGRSDFAQSAALFRKAADRGFHNAQFNLASLYLQGKGVEENTGEAYKWFLIAARDGDIQAQQQVRELSAQLSDGQRALAESEAARFKPMSESPVIVAQN